MQLLRSFSHFCHGEATRHFSSSIVDIQMSQKNFAMEAHQYVICIVVLFTSLPTM